MDALYLEKSKIRVLENQRKGLCLISAFFQGMESSIEGARQCQEMITNEIVNAMTFVSDNVHFFGDISPASYDTISRWNAERICEVSKGRGLYSGEFWNIEILEKYIELAKIPVMVFYYIEVTNNCKFAVK